MTEPVKDLNAVSSEMGDQNSATIYPTIEIKHRYTGAVLFSTEAPSVSIGVAKAVSGGTNLRYANLSGTDLRGTNLSGADLSGTDLRGTNLRDTNLRGADLSGADLRGADLRGTNLRGTDLRGTNLRYANLSGADLRGTNLSGANLSGANLSGTDLRGTNLSYADLSGTNLSGTNLRGADLRGTNLRGTNLRGTNLRDTNLSGANLRDTNNINLARGLEDIRNDIWSVLLKAPSEVPALRQALMDGKIDGSVYEGDCACLVGTIAKARQCRLQDLPVGILPDSDRAAERWFWGIRPGQTPDNHPISKITLEWIDEFQASMEAARNGGAQ